MSTPPIAFAVMGNDFDLVKERLASGCDINEITDKGSALHVACIYKRYEIGRFLLENGADPHSKDKLGQKPIDVADDEQMVALLREFGVTQFGIYHFNQLQRDGQRNALVLGNANSVEILTEQLDPVDHFYGIYVPWISIDHLNVLEREVASELTNPDSPIGVSAEGKPRLFQLDTALLRGVELDDDELFDLAAVVYKARPFKKLKAWDKYSVFLLLCQLRSLSFVAKKRKLRLYFQQWHDAPK